MLLFLATIFTGFLCSSEIVTIRSPTAQATCFGDCFNTTYCFEGSSYFNLQKLSQEIIVTWDFTPTQIVPICHDSEDDLWFRSVLHKSTPAQRLQLLKQQESSLFSKITRIIYPSETSKSATTTHNLLRISPFGQSCFQTCARSASAEEQVGITGKLYLTPRNLLFPLPWFPLALGALLLVSASKLSTSTEFYYISGATLGVCFAISVFVLIFFYFTNNRTSATRSQFGIAALLQGIVVYLRSSLFNLLSEYLEYVLIYVGVSFVVSLALLHYSVKRGPSGGVELNSALCDLLRVGLSSAGAFIIAHSVVASTRWQLYIVVLVAVFTAPGQSLKVEEKTNSEDDFVSFLIKNHQKIVLRKLSDVPGEEAIKAPPQL